MHYQTVLSNMAQILLSKLYLVLKYERCDTKKFGSHIPDFCTVKLISLLLEKFDSFQPLFYSK